MTMSSRSLFKMLNSCNHSRRLNALLENKKLIIGNSVKVFIQLKAKTLKSLHRYSFFTTASFPFVSGKISLPSGFRLSLIDFVKSFC